MTVQEYEQAKDLYLHQKMSFTKIANILNINRKELSQKLKQENLYNGKGYSNKQIQLAKDMLKEGKNITFISKQLGVDRVLFSRALEKANVRNRIKPNHYKFDYCSNIAKNIIKDYRNGMKRKEILKKYNLNTDKILYSLLDYYNIDIINNNRIYNIDETIFEHIDTEEKAYWLGFLYADGYIYDNNNSYQLSVGLSQHDCKHLFKFQSFMKAENPIYNKTVILKGKKYNTVRIDIGSKKIVNDLEKLGCIQTKSLIIKFPSVEIVPEYLHRHFIRGYFDGDGSVYNILPKDCKNKQLRIEILGTIKILDTIKEIFYNNLNISKKRKYYNDGKAYKIKFGGNIICKKIYDYLYDNANIFLNRKKLTFYAVLGRDA